MDSLGLGAGCALPDKQPEPPEAPVKKSDYEKLREGNIQRNITVYIYTWGGGYK
jgi:hypothetical protein